MESGQLSSVLPLPVELVAGKGCVDAAPGLGGSGRSGSSEVENVDEMAGP
jgi:hypothetical protein